jgi:hypothetical protein
MRGKILRWLVHATPWGLAAALALIVVPVPFGAFTKEPSPPSEEHKQAEQDRCEFLMGNVSSIILSLNPEGDITFLNRYGQNFFGYSEGEIIGKPMLGTLTPPTGFKGRDLMTFLAGVVRHPNRYAFSVNENMLRNGERVTIFWANKGIADDRGGGGKFSGSASTLLRENAGFGSPPNNCGTLARCCKIGPGFSGKSLKRSQAASKRSVRSWKGRGWKPSREFLRAWRLLIIKDAASS